MQIIDFIQDFPIQEFQKGDVLLSEGQQNNKLLALRSGFVKVTSLHESGSEKLLWIAGRYDIVPTEQLFSLTGNLHYFYTALSKGSLYEIDKISFLQYAKSNPSLMTEVARGMSSHYDDLMNRLDSVEQTTIRGKIIFTLCYLAERFSADNEVDLLELGLVLTQNDIASMVGSTRETISVELNLLKSHGAIMYDRNKFIINLQKLRKLDV
jgi:CRP/FNR family transcriptional regulator, cyclic AMP receptor protein